MRYYSNITKKLYDTAEECEQDEKRQEEEATKSMAEQASRIKEIEDAWTIAYEAIQKHSQLVEKYKEDYPKSIRYKGRVTYNRLPSLALFSDWII